MKRATKKTIKGVSQMVIIPVIIAETSQIIRLTRITLIMVDLPPMSNAAR